MKKKFANASHPLIWSAAMAVSLVMGASTALGLAGHLDWRQGETLQIEPAQMGYHFF